MSRLPKPFPVVNPSPGTTDSCDPNKVVVYLSSKPTDKISRPSLSLLGQELACRRFSRHQLHRTIEAEFADGMASRPPQPNRTQSLQPGFNKLLAHIALCQNQRVVVARLDRLPAPKSVHQLGHLDVRVLSATEPNTQARTSQAEMAASIRHDIGELFPERTSKRKVEQ